MAKSPYPLSSTEAESIFNSSPFSAGVKNNWDSGNGVLVDDPFGGNRGTVLEIRHKKDMWATGKSTVAPPVPSGVIVPDIGWAGTPSDEAFSELYFAYDVAFPAGFIFPLSMHMASMKILGSAVNYTEYPRAGIAERNPTTSYSLMNGSFQLNAVEANRVPPGADHSFGTYYYNALNTQRIKLWTDDPASGTENVNTGASYVKFIRGRWHSLEMRIKLNTLQSPYNGILQAWFDGKLVLDLQDFAWLKSPYLGKTMNTVRFMHHYGGDSQKFAAAQDQSLFVDRVTLSNNPITH